jgi:hypothetical protein
VKRICLVVLGTALAFAVSANAQQNAGSSAPAARSGSLPGVDDHLKVLSEKLDLTAEQQDKARPILKEMQDAMEKVMDNQSLTQEQMHEQIHPIQAKADKELRTFLRDEQKQKLDALEQQMHEQHSKQ